MPHPSQFSFRFAAVALALLLAACSPSGSDNEQVASRKPQATSTPAPAPPATASNASATDLPSFVNLVKQQGPAVVNISTVQIRTSGGDPLLEFFGESGDGPGADVPVEGMGTGFIISEDGYVLTNAHVVTESEELLVKLTTKREYKAKVIGADLYTDVALIKIDAKDLPVVKIGQSEPLEPGEWVAAIGAPFGFENSVTVGVVSAKERMLPDGSFIPFIQTDVAVNPGNSGGPLFSLRGEVVGMNAMILSQTGGFMGISFAIPIDIAMDVARELRQNGKVTRGRIGVQVQELTVDLAESFGLKNPAGALVAAVEPNAPAQKAGLQAGDIVVAIGEQAVESSADLARLVAGTKPGATVNVHVWRNGKRIELPIKVEEMPVPAAG